jgi:hypothetical protein
MLEDFEEDFYNEGFTEDQYQQVSRFINIFLEEDETSIYKDNYECFCSHEIPDRLNKILHIDIINEDLDMEICISFESGCNVGCELRDYSFNGSSLRYEPKYHEILDDVVVDWDRVDEWKEELEILAKTKNISIKIPSNNEIQSIFDENKDLIIKKHQEQEYDNYVTGGGTNLTDEYYRNFNINLNKQGVFYIKKYKTIQVDRNIR